VLGFDDSVARLAPFTRDHAALEAAFAGLRARDRGHRLFDTMSEALELLGGRKPAGESPVPGRRVLLLISEALDSGSETPLGEVLRRAQLENVTIFSIGLSTTRAELAARPRDNAPVPATPPGIMGAPVPPGTVPTPAASAAA